MTDIDATVAEFAAELEGLAVIEPAAVLADVVGLSSLLLDAPSHEAAVVELRRFLDDHPHTVDYARAVVVAALARFGAVVIFTAPADRLAGDDGLTRRMLRLAWAARGLGLGDVAQRAGVA